MVKRALLIAYHFPPVRVSSGIQRTLKFAQYLPEFGWQPSVLSIHPRAYSLVSDDQLKEIPASITVKRALGWDTARHLSIKGRYPRFLALPDRWVSWWLGGVAAGLRLIRKERPLVLFSTYPIATAHLIGLTLHKITGVPWVADCRDSMTEPHYPADEAQRKAFQWIERHTVANCARMVFTTPGALCMYRDRYPHVSETRWAMIANGYDEENFSRATGQLASPRNESDRLILVHSGLLYPSERNPIPFFQALADLKQRKRISADTLQIVLRASGHEQYFKRYLEQYAIQDIVKFEPTLPYETALREMLEADGLLLFQAANCNHQIPAKVYEYLRARRPILAVTDHAGDTAKLLVGAGIDSIVSISDCADIARGLEKFLEQMKQGGPALPDMATVLSHSRHARTRELAELFDQVIVA